MNKVESNLLTPNQFTKLMMLTMIGVGTLSLPNAIIKGAKQDGWLSTVICAIYPLYMVLMAAFLSKKYPNENILVLSKKYLGGFLGSLMNFLFLLVFIINIILETTGVDNFLRTYIIEFLSSFQFLIVFIPMATLTAYRGLKVLGSISEIIFYSCFIIVAVTLLAIYRGSFLNVMPVLSSGVINIIKGARYGLYAYSGIEVVLLVYPHIDDKSKILKSNIKAVLMTCAFYTWISFTTIYYLGVSIIKKTLWSTLYIIESLRLPIINNFRVVAMFLWTFISINIVAILYYSCGVILKDIMKSLSRKTIFIAMTPIIIISCLYLGNEIRRREIMSLIVPYIIGFNILYVTIIAVLIIIKNGGNNED